MGVHVYWHRVMEMDACLLPGMQKLLIHLDGCEALIDCCEMKSSLDGLLKAPWYVARFALTQA
eukprot:12438277-Ditylum_brightwellii.AAC.1